MSTFHGILAYGFDLGGPELGWKLANLDEGGRPEKAPWLDQAEHSMHYQDTMMSHLMAEQAGFREEYRDGWAGYRERQTAAWNSLGVEIHAPGHPDRPGYLLAARFMRTPGYGTITFDPDILAVDESHRVALARALNTLGIKPLQERAQWILGAEL